jgi:hypothetical protein
MIVLTAWSSIELLLLQNTDLLLSLTCCRQTIPRAEDVFHGNWRAFTNYLETDEDSRVRACKSDRRGVRLSACVVEY